jgi:tetratricopeptide (TPR) repeat protein
LGYTYLWSGHPEKALEQCQLALKNSNHHAWILHLEVLVYLRMGKTEDARKKYEEMEKRYKDGRLPPSNMAIVAAELGKINYALELTQVAVDVIDPYLAFMLTNLKDSGALRQIPEFEEIKNQLGYFSQLNMPDENK